ncbi:amino acid adenylation domain-containing protein [Streptomyces sp. NPDC048409]|uniref:non-ribosomal peptide synthetase n=1 Tax=Streptomyces sp. NPDC048409 TaxID=3154723 RepID=UPI003419B512
MNSAPRPAPTLEATPHQAAQLIASLLSDRHRVGTLPVRIPLDGEGTGGAAAVTGLAEVQRAWTALLRSAAALRVRFHDTPERLVQELRGYDDLPEETARVTLGDEDADADGLEPFGPVLLTARLDLRGSGPVLALRVHHALVDEHSVLLVGRALRHFLAHPDAVPEDDQDHYRRAQEALLDASRRELPPRPHDPAPPRPADSGAADAPLLSRPGGDPRQRAHHAVRLAPGTVAALRRTARRARASAVSVAHAAVLAALHRLAPDRTPVVGVPMTLRDLRAVGFDAVGLYLNVVPTTVPCSAADTFGELVERVRAESLALHGRKFASVGDLAAADGVARPGRPGNRAYADLVLAFRDGSLPPGTDERATAARRSAEPGAPLNVEVVLGPEDGLILFDWRSGLVPWPPAPQLASAVVQALTELPARPELRVGDFALLDTATTAEVRRRLGGHPPTAGAPAPSVVELVERAAALAPGAPAVSDGEHVWSYDELTDAVVRVRAALRSRELPRGTRVAAACGHDVWQVATALALWQEGLCYVPLDPRGPAERNRFVLADSASALVVCGPGTAGAPFLAGTPERDVLTTDALPPRPDGGTAAPGGRPGPDEPAYLMYTSGTTGRPKGVTVTHHNLAGFLRAMTLALPGASQGDWLAETSPSFDISYVEMFWPLTHGRHVQLRSPDARENPADRRPFEHRQCTPARAGQLLTARELGHSLGRWDVAPRYWLLGGERLPGPLLRRLRAAYPDTVFVNMYGPTEATVWATYHVVRGDEGADVPLGRPLPNSGVLVTDPHGNDVPEGVVGELLVIGDSVAAGYLNRPEATRRRFVPAATADGARAYRTGDLVCSGPDGRLYFRGRDDDQVKIRGHRVEPGELEQRLLALPGVREAVAVVLDADDPERVRLAAAVTVAGSASFDPADARRELEGEVPEAMLPAELVVLDALPRLTNGKTDRLAVRTACEAAAAGTHGPAGGPVPDRGPGAASTSASASAGDPGSADVRGADASGGVPDPALGAVLAAAEKIFHRAVGGQENFFDLGGNSLTALRLTALVRAEGFHLEVEDVFDLPDMRALADQATPTAGGRG